MTMMAAPSQAVQIDCSGCSKNPPIITQGAGSGPEISITFNFGASGKCAFTEGGGCGQEFACEYSYDVMISGVPSGWTETTDSRTFDSLLLTPPPFREGMPMNAQNGTETLDLEVGCALTTDRIHQIEDGVGEDFDAAAIRLRCDRCFP